MGRPRSWPTDSNTDRPPIPAMVGRAGRDRRQQQRQRQSRHPLKQRAVRAGPGTPPSPTHGAHDPRQAVGREKTPPMTSRRGQRLTVLINTHAAALSSEVLGLVLRAGQVSLPESSPSSGSDSPLVRRPIAPPFGFDGSTTVDLRPTPGSSLSRRGSRLRPGRTWRRHGSHQR